MVSVVLPVFNEQQNLGPVVAEIAAVLAEVNHEIVAVDDGSTDGSLAELLKLTDEYETMCVVPLTQHLGQSAAFVAGFDKARGQIIVTMDADGQNDPHDIPEFLDRLEADPKLGAVLGYRVARADAIWKRLQSRVANAVRNWLTRDTIRDTGCSLKAIRRRLLHGVPRFDGMHRFLGTLIRGQGARVIEVPVSHRARLSGNSKYGMWDRLYVGLRDALGVRWLGRRAIRYRVRSGEF